jgi:uncharacterized protein GlcG (DUF336 family)
VDIALGKARAALTFGCTSKEIADALAGNPLAGPSVIATLQGRVLLLAGGVLIHDQAGETIGALGAAGDAPDNDEAIVLAATDAKGMSDLSDFRRRLLTPLKCETRRL